MRRDPDTSGSTPFRPRRGRPAACAAALWGALLLAGCASPPPTCGEWQADGSPPVIRSQDQRICAVVRAGAQDLLGRAYATTEVRRIEDLYARLGRLGRADRVEQVVSSVGEIGFPEIAEEIASAAGRVRARMEERPPPDDPEEAERRLALGAVRGLTLALEDLYPHLYEMQD